MYSVQRIVVPRSARYHCLGDRTGPEEVWFVLHGFSQLAAGFLRWFEPAARPGRRRARHGHRDLPRRRLQGVPHGERRGAAHGDAGGCDGQKIQRNAGP